MADNTTKKENSSFTKEQLVKSKKYFGKADLLNALLDDDKTYSISTVDDLINSYLKKEVN